MSFSLAFTYFIHYYTGIRIYTMFAKWRKNNPPYGKDKINDLQKTLVEVQTNNNKSQEEVMEVSRKLQDATRMKKNTGIRKVGTCGTHQGILIQTFIML